MIIEYKNATLLIVKFKSLHVFSFYESFHCDFNVCQNPPHVLAVNIFEYSSALSSYIYQVNNKYFDHYLLYHT